MDGEGGIEVKGGDVTANQLFDRLGASRLRPEAVAALAAWRAGGGKQVSGPLPSLGAIDCMDALPRSLCRMVGVSKPTLYTYVERADGAD
jgi:hypothetical protein